MMDIEIKPIDRIIGEVEMPGDKSISHRAVMIGSISNGNTQAGNFLTGEDCMRTIDAFKKMRVEISVVGKTLKINGTGLKGLKKPHEALYLGNSGTTMRLISGILAGGDFETTLTGDESLTRRPMDRIIEPLTLMGASISSINNNGCAPLKIKGRKLKSVKYKTKIASAQVKSCILLAGLHAEGVTVVEEPFQSRDHTERMLEHFGADIKRNEKITSIKSKSSLTGKKIQIPGDISSAANFVVLALILEGSELTIRSVGINPTRSKIIDVLQRMGADIKIVPPKPHFKHTCAGSRRISPGEISYGKNGKKLFEPICDLSITSSNLHGITVTEEEIPEIIDEIPVLCVAAAQASGTTEIRGVGELRVKETDRIKSMVDNLENLGVGILSKDNNIYIEGRKKRFSSKYKLAKNLTLSSFGDHRTAMAMCVAAASSDGSCKIRDIDCINTSFPEFFDIFNYVRR